MRFEGLIFETPTSPFNKEVISINQREVLGIKAISQLRYENKNPDLYKQLLVKMDDNGGWKSEIICVFTKIKFE